MEPSFPQKRIAFIIKQANIRHVFTQRKHASIFSDPSVLIFEDEPFDEEGADESPSTASAAGPNVTDPPDAPVNHGDDAMYVLYTSGTTGEPKGVIVEQRNVCNYVRAFKNEFHPTERDRMLQNSVCTFDIFVEEVFPILLSGGALIIADETDKESPRALRRLMETEGVTMITGFPYLLSELNALEPNASLRLAISGGDVLRKEHVDRLVGKTAVYNTYGPTETTVCVSYYHYTDPTIDADTVPIGKAVLGTQMHLLDDDLHPVEPGTLGEIGISGAGVARGYQNNEVETAAHFVDNPFGPGKLYLSGDLGYLRPDGNVEFVKRKDAQTMIDGRRVEPLEVENVLYRFPGIDAAVVKPFLDENGYPYLVGYYQTASGIELDALERFLAQYLPDFMIPESLIGLDSLPKTASGKIDRENLPVILKKASA